MSKEFAHYIFVRRDLPVGLVGAMVTHAAGESVREAYTNPSYNLDRDYGLPKHTAAIVLAALDEQHLERILSYLIREDLAFKAIHEEGGDFDGQLMAIGLIPTIRYKISHKLKDFILLRELDIPSDGEV